MQNDTQHTPGPWVCSRYPVTEDTYHHAIFATARDDGRGVTIATVYPISDDGQPGAESHCNARLITAAPDLLEALRGIFAQTEKHSRQWGQVESARAFAADPDTAKAFAAARAAISRAEGR